MDVTHVLLDFCIPLRNSPEMRKHFVNISRLRLFTGRKKSRGRNIYFHARISVSTVFIFVTYTDPKRAIESREF